MSTIIKNMNCFVDGRGYAGKVDEITPPVLTRKTEEYRGGGMSAPVDIDLGMEKMETSFVLSSYEADVIGLWGCGKQIATTFKGAAQNQDGTVVSINMGMRGLIKAIDKGTWTPGEKSTLSVNLGLSYYREIIDGKTIHEIDPVAMIEIINGVDLMQSLRAAIGI